jgi:secreted Zn-dependent insulinase-like peptidase
MQEEPLQQWAGDVIVPEKSPNDARTYEAVRLPNQIQLLLVHDPLAERGACSVSVNVGSLRDGERSLGLAHFLEHMLFMGSRSFPRHNEYSEFISLNSGMDNAWTSDEETNYYF